MMKKVDIQFELLSSDGAELMFSTTGDVAYGNNVILLSFTENTDLELEDKVYIYKDKIQLYREGFISSFQTFIKNEDTIIQIKSKSGYEIIATTFTFDLKINNNDIFVKYKTELDYEKGIIHIFKIKW